MNQDQVKEKLLKLDPDVENFTVTFSGKTSKKVDGLYKPDTREIIIHNKNHEDDNALMYTAIHEFAHHIQFCRSATAVTSRSHTTVFWDILHRLLFRAEEMGMYVNIFEKDPELIELAGRIRKNYLDANAVLMKNFGEILTEAQKLCIRKHASFDDFMDRVLKLPRATARTLLKIHGTDIDPRIGYENMKTVASIRDDDKRRLAQEAFLEGNSPDMVKAEFSSRKIPDSRLDQLLVEKEKIQNNLEKLTVRLARIERQIRELE